ncbi:ESX secretion-associated protein EspG [Nocardia mangyaensis]|uniref:ESX secretion-associated protein EspG n=1 Tax=Nocardia mangyaensis TaxID=2213200 RepID=A0A1J0VMM4_9NOCA|nr:ESX secretion-associated protein EspG [Nocardia mangyaensis]APE33266.1 ESX secretion-associated protein EspG [Nocardia mangyaensis]
MTVLTNDGLLAVAERLRVQTLPLVLAVRPTQETLADWQAARRAAEAELTGTGILDGDEVANTELVGALLTLSQPDRELVARIFRGGAPVRICLARRGEAHALAVRTGDSYVIEPIWVDGSGQSLARPILAQLGPLAAADVAAFSAPATDLAERFDAAENAADYADAVYHLGVAATDATRYGLALGDCHTYAEIVACHHEGGATERATGAVAVYDTAAGRIVAAPGRAPDLRIWSTVTPGTDHRIAQAISALIELLPGGRWLPQ